jgi:hypothetical protein
MEGWVSLSLSGVTTTPRVKYSRTLLRRPGTWRKNPLAWRIISITTDYVVGDRITLTSPNISASTSSCREFWHHPKNRVDLRLEAMCDELSRSGDLFVLLFRNPGDGMSYIRFVTKDRIRARSRPPKTTGRPSWLTTSSSKTAARGNGSQPQHPEAPEREAVMLHYAINRPLGALLGESDLTSMLTWLQTLLSQMLDDRVHAALGNAAFLWIITVPTDRVDAKRDVLPHTSGHGDRYRQG